MGKKRSLAFLLCLCLMFTFGGCKTNDIIVAAVTICAIFFGEGCGGDGSSGTKTELTQNPPSNPPPQEPTPTCKEKLAEGESCTDTVGIKINVDGARLLDQVTSCTNIYDSGCNPTNLPDPEPKYTSLPPYYKAGVVMVPVKRVGETLLGTVVGDGQSPATLTTLNGSFSVNAEVKWGHTYWPIDDVISASQSKFDNNIYKQEETKTVDGVKINIYNIVTGLGSQVTQLGKVVISNISHDIVLTFDDGPYVLGDGKTATTQQLLDALGTGNYASFFVNGLSVGKDSAHEQITQSLANKSNEIANHTYSHEFGDKIFMINLSADKIREEIIRARLQFLKALSGNTTYVPIHFRPPHGSGSGLRKDENKNPEPPELVDAVQIQVGTTGHKMINWNLEAGDEDEDKILQSTSKTITAFDIYNKVTKDPAFLSGSAIVLMHNGRKKTVQAVRGGNDDGSVVPDGGIIGYPASAGSNKKFVALSNAF